MPLWHVEPFFEDQKKLSEAVLAEKGGVIPGA